MEEQNFKANNKSQIHGKPSALSGDWEIIMWAVIQAGRGCQSNCAQSSISLMSEGARRFVLAVTLPTSDICHPEFAITAASKKLYLPVKQLFYWMVEGGLLSLLLGNSPLFEYMYPVIPFHASPDSLSLSGGRELCLSPSSLMFGRRAAEWRGYCRQSKRLWLHCRGSEQSLPSGSTGKRYLCHPCPPGKLTFAFIMPLKIVDKALDVFAYTSLPTGNWFQDLPWVPPSVNVQVPYIWWRIYNAPFTTVR